MGSSSRELGCIKPSFARSLASRNQGFIANPEGELYGEPVPSVGLRGNNCQTAISFLERMFSHCLDGSPNVPQAGEPGRAVGWSKTPVVRGKGNWIKAS